MNLNQLYYFQKVAQLQHYHQAAKELNISQPSLSRSIANLEEELRTQYRTYQIRLYLFGTCQSYYR